MGVTFVDAKTSTSGNVVTVTGLTWPTHQAGDLALFIGGCVDTATPVLDALLTQIRQDIDQNLKATVASRLPGAMTGSESGSIDFHVGGAETNRMTAAIALFRAVAALGTVTYLAEGGTAVSTHHSPSVTLNSADDGICVMYEERQSTSASTITPPAGYTAPVQFGTGGSGGTVVCVAYKLSGNSAGSNAIGDWSSTNTASNCTVYAFPIFALITASPAGIASGESWGTPGETSNLPLSPSGIASGEAWGAVAAVLALTASPTGIASGEQWGIPAVSSTLQVSPAGIPTAEAWGALTAALALAVSPVGIATGQAFGVPGVALSVAASPTGISTLEAWGLPTASGSLQTGITGVPTGEAWGTPSAQLSLQAAPIGIAPGEAWGSPIVTIGVPPVQRDLTLYGVLEVGRFAAVIEVGRWSGTLEQGRWKGAVPWPDQ